MIKAIIFDCFGVLVGKGFWGIYQDLGGDVAKDEVYINQKLDEANSGRMASENFSVEMSERLGISLEQYHEAFAKDEMPNEKLFEYIEHSLLGNYKLALVSNATGKSVRSKIPTEKLALFDTVLISAEIGLLKPNPKMFEFALNRLSVKAEEVLFVDDHQEYVDGAIQTGLHAVRYTGLKSLQSALSQYN